MSKPIIVSVLQWCTEEHAKDGRIGKEVLLLQQSL